jgi:hypothetical protein
MCNTWKLKNVFNYCVDPLDSTGMYSPIHYSGLNRIPRTSQNDSISQSKWATISRKHMSQDITLTWSFIIERL